MGKNNGNKYLVFDSTELHFTDENKEVLKKYRELWDCIKNETETIKGDKKGIWSRFMKIKFNTNDSLPLNKPLNLNMLTIIVRCVFEEDGKFYPQLYFDDCLYKV